MQIRFRLYDGGQNDYTSTFFDLISGNKETKQTKGLAYILSQDENFLFSFLSLKEIKTSIKKNKGTFSKKTITSIEISAEKITKSNKRADIVIKLNKHNRPFVAIIIEAKSVISNIKYNKNILSQLNTYLKDEELPDLRDYKKIGLILTKYKQNFENIINIDWNYLIDFITKFSYKHDNLIIRQYLEFITKIDGNMNYYEEEVISIPAGKSYKCVQKHLVYECPNTKNYSYKKPIFITFRQKGGIMEYLYKIQTIVILDPNSLNDYMAFKNSTISDEIKKQIIDYINDNPNISGEKRFYVLSKNEIIELKNKPKPKNQIRKHIYYSLHDILTKKKLIPISQRK